MEEPVNVMASVRAMFCHLARTLMRAGRMLLVALKKMYYGLHILEMGEHVG